MHGLSLENKKHQGKEDGEGGSNVLVISPKTHYYHDQNLLRTRLGKREEAVNGVGLGSPQTKTSKQ